jgi:hypothetical protein
MTDKSDLVTLVESYIHRANSSVDDNIGAWIDFATKRIGRDLRSQENLISVDLTPLVNPVVLPDNYRELKVIQYPGDGNSDVSLRSVPAPTIARLTNTGSSPAVYSVSGFNMTIKPFQAKTFAMQYWAEPDALVVDTDENDVLNAYPYIYLYAVLIEAQAWLQDFTQRSQWVATYSGEVGVTNEQSQSADLGNAPAMAGV